MTAQKTTLIFALLLSGCGTAVVKDRVQTVSVPVPQACTTERPAPVSTLKQDYTDEQWNALDVRQKAAAVGRKGLEHKAYGEDLNAATGACQ